MGRCGKVAMLITDIETVGIERTINPIERRDDEICDEWNINSTAYYNKGVPMVVEAIASSAFEAGELVMLPSSRNGNIHWPSLYALVPPFNFEHFKYAFSKLRILKLIVLVARTDPLREFYYLTGLFSSLSQLEQLSLMVDPDCEDYWQSDQVMQTKHILQHYYPCINNVYLEWWVVDVKDFSRFIQRHKDTLVAVEVCESIFDCTSALDSAWVKPLRGLASGETITQILKQKTGFDGIQLSGCSCVDIRDY